MKISGTSDPINSGEFELKPTIEGILAAEKALAIIKQRSFSGRNPELGKMFKCQVCRTRHRKSKVCEQVFATAVVHGLIPGGDHKAPRMAAQNTAKGVIGAAAFKGKRIKPHLNKRAKEFIQVVHSLINDDYTKEELAKARNKAKRILAAKYGRHGFLPPVWQKFPEKAGNVKEAA